jgi:hypothetical protein
VQKSVLLAAIQKEIQRHDLSYFVSDPPSVAQGGRGVVEECPGMSNENQYGRVVFAAIWQTMQASANFLTNKVIYAIVRDWTRCLSEAQAAF